VLFVDHLRKSMKLHPNELWACCLRQRKVPLYTVSVFEMPYNRQSVVLRTTTIAILFAPF
jgi:hypothetical protein